MTDRVQGGLYGVVMSPTDPATCDHIRQRKLPELGGFHQWICEDCMSLMEPMRPERIRSAPRRELP